MKGLISKYHGFILQYMMLAEINQIPFEEIEKAT